MTFSPYQLALAAALLTLAACAANAPAARRSAAEQVALDAHWQPLLLATDTFALRAFAPETLQAGNELTIYIEGDGAAWIDANTPSFDPTPREPTGLQLALRDDSNHAVYLARPCQYVAGDERRNCSARYWTNRRFAPEVVAAANQAIDQLKRRYGAQRLQLIGYSGGGAIAALVAARRRDVVRLVTVAGNLDTDTWTQEKGIAPLTGSLNPAAAWQALARIPQLHFVGADDTTMPATVARHYRDRFTTAPRPVVVVVPGYDHHCCWVRDWPTLQRTIDARLR